MAATRRHETGSKGEKLVGRARWAKFALASRQRQHAGRVRSRKSESVLSFNRQDSGSRAPFSWLVFGER